MRRVTRASLTMFRIGASPCTHLFTPRSHDLSCFCLGSTMFSGIAEHCHKELTHLAPSSIKVKVVARPKRKYSVLADPFWIRSQPSNRCGSPSRIDIT